MDSGLMFLFVPEMFLLGLALSFALHLALERR
jgi:hypothetical protein